MRLRVFGIALVAFALGSIPGPAHAVPPPQKVKAKYVYQLSDSTGPVSSSWASLAYDAQHKELYVVDRSDGSVAIFNDVGMEIYRFGNDAEIGTIVSIDVMDGGDLLVLAMEKGSTVLQRCNFRGQPKERIELRNLTPDFAKEFSPDTVAVRGGKLYLADKGRMKVVVADATGNRVEEHDYFSELGLDKLKDLRAGRPGMHTFKVAGDGTVLFTVAPMFKVFLIPPGGQAASFGQKGGAPGKFNIVGGVDRDARGYIFVSDVLKCAILVFDDKFEFVGQFGARGWDREDFIAPLEIAVADGRLYVSQSAGRGVSVLEISGPEAVSGPGGVAAQPAVK